MKLDNSIFIEQRFFEVMRKVNDSDKLSPKTAYKFSRLVRELDTHFQTYNGKRLELVNEYGTPDPEREGVSMVQGENKDVFVEKFVLDVCGVTAMICFTSLSGIKTNPTIIPIARIPIRTNIKFLFN